MGMPRHRARLLRPRGAFPSRLQPCAPQPATLCISGARAARSERPTLHAQPSSGARHAQPPLTTSY
eukprot:scaffold13817_cov33-Phaeocystis_antarctica.AAC.1